MKKTTFGDKLRKIRKSQNLTQSELGEKVKPDGMSQAAIGQFESREKAPKKETVIKLAAALNVNPADLDEDLAIDLSETSEGALLPDENGEYRSNLAGSDSDRFYTIRNVLTEEAFEQWLEIGEAFIDVPSRRKDNGRGLNKEEK